MKYGIILFIAFYSCLHVQAKLINVPSDYVTIQKGINGATNGDTVLVSPGTYFENINFNGKNIVVASNYIKTGSVDDIKNTIIDGSKPHYADSASCVFFSSGEDSSAVIEGFTLTKGKGTRYLYPNGWFREGGGVFVNNAAPTIKHNLIIGNEVLSTTNVTSAGGGGIRSNLGNPHIYNNVIMLNKALFGAAIVLDYSNGSVKNNIIYQNTGATAYGGGGAFWIYGPNCSVIIENNTITANSTGGLFIQTIKMSIVNNIIWGNDIFQVSTSEGFGKVELSVTNNIVQGGYANNQSSSPLFTDTAFLLQPLSPAIDAGMVDNKYNDVDDKLNIGKAHTPSLGTVRNDVGAYGGQNATFLPAFDFNNIAANTINFGTANSIGVTALKKLVIANQSTKSVFIDSIKKSASSKIKIVSFTAKLLLPLHSDTISLEWTPQDDIKFSDSILIYHSLKNIANPLKVYISGKAKTPTLVKKSNNDALLNIYQYDLNESAYLRYKGVKQHSQLFIFNMNGQVIRTIMIDNTEGNLKLSSNAMSSGIYIYKLKSDNSLLSGKFIIRK